MLDFKGKYSINKNSSQQTYTIKSQLQPRLSEFNLEKTTLIWYRHPPPPFQIQELTFNFNKRSYKCSSLDYECSMVCKVIGQNGKQVSRFDYGPIQTFLYNKLSANLELRVQVLLFNTIKKCILSFNPAPTLINPQNNNKYQLTQQDIKSIYLKTQNSTQNYVEQESNQNDSVGTKYNKLDQISLLNNKRRKIIVVQNLFQRLILLKLFHQIPNGMYCYSMELLQVSFYDQSSCNMGLFAINRHKYMKKEISQISKSMFSHSQQDLARINRMKKSNQSLAEFKTKLQADQQSNLSKKLSVDQPRKQMFSYSGFGGFKKSPKQSMNSGKESLMSGNQSRATQSRTSLVSKLQDANKNMIEFESKQLLSSPGSSQMVSRISIKQPKVSILSTDINSIKGTRQQKPSFPQTPTPTPTTQTLKFSQLIIKSNDFKSSLSLRRSQDELKTPRMDAEEDSTTNKPQGHANENSTSQMQVTGQPEQQDKYVDEFENLLFQTDGQNNDQDQQMCLNDSFIRMEQQQKQTQNINIQVNRSQQPDHNLLRTMAHNSPTKSQRKLISLRQKFSTVLLQNHELKQKNQKLKKQIEWTKVSSDGRHQLTKYQDEIARMRKIQQELFNQISQLKRTTNIKSDNQALPSQIDNKKQQQRNGDNVMNTNQQPVPQSFQNSRVGFVKYAGLCSPPRQSKHVNELSYQPVENPPGACLVGRISQQNQLVSYNYRQNPISFGGSNTSIGGGIFNSGQQRFTKLQNDPDYQKFRNNQSYSYKVIQNTKSHQWKTGKQSFLKY